MTFKDIVNSVIWRYMTSMGFVLLGKGDSPPTPDYVGAAQQTAQGNLEAARASAAANRVNQYTPYGNLVYSHNAPSTVDYNAYNTALANYQNQLKAYNSWTPTSGGNTTGMGGGTVFGGSGSRPAMPVAPNISQFTTTNPDEGWAATQTLSPAQQIILDQNSQLTSGLLSTANSGLDYANKVLSRPGVDMSTLPQVGINPGQSYQDAMMARLQPQIDRENQQSDAQLANQGITPGSQAYINAKTLLNQSHNDLLNNATVQGFNTGLAANQNSFQQQSYNQMQPINVINALRTGSQVTNPNFVNVPQQNQTAGPDILGATQAGYNADLASANAQNAAGGNLMSGLFSLGGAALMSPYGAKIFSDRRLKKNIVRIGQYANGLVKYAFDYLWDEHGEGAMADEVEKVIPEAVSTVCGYKAVNYALVGA